MTLRDNLGTNVVSPVVSLSKKTVNLLSNYSKTVGFEPRRSRQLLNGINR